MAISNAEIFYNQILDKKDDAFEFLRQLSEKSSNTSENEWRDFKDIHWYKNPNYKTEYDQEEKLKDIWSECIGAFANTGGGVLIWGINAPGRIAVGLKLSIDAPYLADRLLELVKDAIDPPVIGIQVKAILRPNDATNGLVVCYIPESRFRPHSSKFVKGAYFLRVQDGNKVIPAAVLRGMFYPQSSPFMIPTVSAQMLVGDGQKIYWQIDATIRNAGTASAQEVYINVSAHFDRPYEISISSHWMEESRGRDYSCNQTIHPGQSFPFLTNMTTRGYQEMIENSYTLKIVFNIYATHASPQKMEVSFSGEEINAAMLGDGKKITRQTIVSPES